MHPIRFRLLKIFLIARNAFRFNHWRGHGIHSPFIYGLVRNVLVKRRTNAPDILPEELKDYHLLKRDSVFIRNLYAYLGYGECRLAGDALPETAALIVAPHKCPSGPLEHTLREASQRGTAPCCVAVLGVNKSPEVFRLCRATVKTAECVSVDLYRTYLFFFDPKLKKQYYRIRSRHGDPLIHSLPLRAEKTKKDPS